MLARLHPRSRYSFEHSRPNQTGATAPNRRANPELQRERAAATGAGTASGRQRRARAGGSDGRRRRAAPAPGLTPFAGSDSFVESIQRCR